MTKQDNISCRGRKLGAVSKLKKYISDYSSLNQASAKKLFRNTQAKLIGKQHSSNRKQFDIDMNKNDDNVLTLQTLFMNTFDEEFLGFD